MVVGWVNGLGLEETVASDLEIVRSNAANNRRTMPQVTVYTDFDNILDEDRLFEEFYRKWTNRFAEELEVSPEGCYP